MKSSTKNQLELTKKYTRDIKSVNSWAVFKILADFISGFDELGELGPSVTIFGSARTDKKDKYYKKATKLSKMLGKRGFNILTGGGPGIMEAANRGAYQVKDIESIGLNIDLPMEQHANPYVTKEKTFDYFFSRKVMLVKYSMAYVIFPGGFGTLDELFEALTLIQTRKVSGVRVFVVGEEFYKGLFEFMRTSMLSEGMIDKEDLEMITLSDDLTIIADQIEISLVNQLSVLKEVGLDSSSYYKSLNEHFSNRKIRKGKDSYSI